MRPIASTTTAGVLAACCATAAAPASTCPAGFSLRAGNLSTALAPGIVWAACEDLQCGTIAFVRDQGETLALRKRLAANWVDDAAAYLNFTKESVLAARRPHRRVPAEPTWRLLPRWLPRRHLPECQAWYHPQMRRFPLKNDDLLLNRWILY